VELCRAWIALGRLDAAAELLERLLAAAQARSGSRITILTLLAVTGSHKAQSYEFLEQALRLGEPEGYVHSFIEAGEAMRLVLAGWMEHKQRDAEPRLVDYAQRLLNAFLLKASSRPARTSAYIHAADAQPARARSAAAGGERSLEPADRRPAGDLDPHGQKARRKYQRQAGGAEPYPGSRPRQRAGPAGLKQIRPFILLNTSFGHWQYVCAGLF
jgi:hypothetical protein